MTATHPSSPFVSLLLRFFGSARVVPSLAEPTPESMHPNASKCTLSKTRISHLHTPGTHDYGNVNATYVSPIGCAAPGNGRTLNFPPPVAGITTYCFPFTW